MNQTSLDAVRSRLADLGRPWTPTDVALALKDQQLVMSDALVSSVVDTLRLTSTGAGLLEPLLRLPGVTDVLVNGCRQVFIDKGDGLESVPVVFESDADVRRLAVRLAASVGRRLDDACPTVDARLKDGTRLHAVLSPVAEPGTCISLRIPRRGGLSLDEWVAGGGVTPRAAAVLTAMVRAKATFLVSGGTGSGKTTLLASLLSLAPERERQVIVEDSRELVPQHAHCVRLEARHANAEDAGAITLTDLVRQALRMRPDRLVLGEVRGAEVTDMMAAMNTGHEGGCGTVHANSAADVPVRIEALAALGGLARDACHAQMASAIAIIVHLRRGDDEVRRVEQIATLQRASSGLVETALALTCHAGVTEPGPGWPKLQQLIGGGL